MSAGDVALLSEARKQQLRQLYRKEDREQVEAMLLELVNDRFGPPERVRYDVLYLAAGDPGKVRAVVDLAKRDPRDVMSQEYFRRNGESYPHEWARIHPVNRDRPRTK